MRTLSAKRSRTARWVWAAAMVILAAYAVAPAGAETPAVDDLLAQVFAPKHKGTYEVTADFTGTLLIHVAAKTWTAIVSGSFKEWRRGGEGLRRRSVAINRFRLPLLLRPFAGALRNIIAQRIETQTEDPAAFHEHDFFLQEYRGDNSYTLVGVHKALVDGAFERYKPSVDRHDPATRRAIAQWIYTSPLLRPWLARGGPPYAIVAVADDVGWIQKLTLLYSWGKITTQFAYDVVEGERVWREVASDISSDIPGLGPLTGHVALIFTNHCLNCGR